LVFAFALKSLFIGELKHVRQLFQSQRPANSESTPSGPEAPWSAIKPLFIIGYGESLRLKTLMRLRWLAIFGQSVMVMIVALIFKFEINAWLCLGIITASAWLNIVLILNYRRGQKLTDAEAALQLGFDCLQLTALLAVTGGSENPFYLMLIAPATVAAANLPVRYGVGVGAVAVISAIGLDLWHLPLPWISGESFNLPPSYRLGVLAAILIGIIFTAGFAGLAAREARRMSNALGATRAVLEKEHRLSALGGLAAAAAHELGTPLGTIQVVAKEMMRALKPDDPLYEDAKLMVSQTQRCRDILKNLSQRPETSDQVYDQMTLRAFLEEIVSPFRHENKIITIDVSMHGVTEGEAGDLVSIKRRPEWMHALSAFVENAIDFATSTVWIRVDIHKTYVSLSVEDDGPGFSTDILPRLGDPYVSTRSHQEMGSSPKSAHGGMGLGFFIAKTLFEHSGAVLSYGNSEGGGASIKALWRRDQIAVVFVKDIEPVDI
jgi:two-component system, sensor histidine kinase RegB